MSQTSITDSYDALLSTTTANRAKQLWDNLSVEIPLFKLIDAGKNKETGMSGHRVEFVLLYGSNSTVKNRADYDTVTLTKQDGITIGYVPWKNLSGAVSISDKEKAMNSGKNQILSLLKGKLDQLEITMKDTMNSDLWSDGSTANQPYGLQYWIQTSAATVAGIDDSVNTWWANKYTTACGSFAANGRDKLRTLRNNCSKGQNSDAVTDILMGQTEYEYFDKTLDGIERVSLNSGQQTVNQGNDTLKFYGSNVRWDADAVSGAAVLLNTSGGKIKWNVLTGMDFDATPFQRMPNQFASASMVNVWANLTISIRKRQGILTGITA